MKQAKLIFNITIILFFMLMVGSVFFTYYDLKKKAFKSGFSGKVISTLKAKRGGNITVEITENELKCFVVISRIKDGGLYPQYNDSIFKNSNSDIMFLKKDKSVEIQELYDIVCLRIDCSAKKKANR
jgi:hypothetical protein